MALLSHSLRAASVISITAVRTLRVEYADLVALLSTRPRLNACLGAVYAEHGAAHAAAIGSAPR